MIPCFVKCHGNLPRNFECRVKMTLGQTLPMFFFVVLNMFRCDNRKDYLTPLGIGFRGGLVYKISK